jgi:hypothetical protein
MLMILQKHKEQRTKTLKVIIIHFEGIHLVVSDKSTVNINMYIYFC